MFRNQCFLSGKKNIFIFKHLTTVVNKYKVVNYLTINNGKNIT